MSETESKTEHKTGAEPTPGPWRTWQAGEDPLINEECVLAEHPDKQEPLLVAEMNRTANDHTDFPGHWKANARLIAAAGTAAQEAKEMGYDPQKAVEALPKLIEATDCGGPVSDALCALKEAADFIEEKTDSKLGARRLHRLADEAADSVGLEIKFVSDSAEGSEE